MGLFWTRYALSDRKPKTNRQDAENRKTQLIIFDEWNAPETSFILPRDAHLWVINEIRTDFILFHFSHWINKNNRRNNVIFLWTDRKSFSGAYLGWSFLLLLLLVSSLLILSLHFSFILTFTENGFKRNRKKIYRFRILFYYFLMFCFCSLEMNGMAVILVSKKLQHNDSI